MSPTLGTLVLKLGERLEREEKRSSSSCSLLNKRKSLQFSLRNRKDSCLTYTFHMEIIYGTEASFPQENETQ